MARGKKPGHQSGDLAVGCSRTFRATSFGLNFDSSHFVWQQMDYLSPVLAEFADRLVHVHAKDARIDLALARRSRRARVSQALAHPNLPGMGDVRWGAFLGVRPTRDTTATSPSKSKTAPSKGRWNAAKQSPSSAVGISFSSWPVNRQRKGIRSDVDNVIPLKQ